MFVSTARMLLADVSPDGLFCVFRWWLEMTRREKRTVHLLRAVPACSANEAVSIAPSSRSATKKLPTVNDRRKSLFKMAILTQSVQSIIGPKPAPAKRRYRQAAGIPSVAGPTSAYAKLLVIT
jgi:hypothetical protein